MDYIQTKKSLGQHFLRNKQILSKVSDSISDDIKTIIEIGPGEGTLTELLLKHSPVVCIEKDDRLIPVLNEKFAKEIKAKKLKVIHGDFLEITDAEIKKIVGKNKFAIVGNIPYYITGAIFQKSLESKITPNELVFLIQKEVADRICGRGDYAPKNNMRAKESILSISIKAFGKPTYLATVDKGQFVPPPKVDSAIIKIESVSHDLFKKNKITIADFFSTVKSGFAHKRKVLRSNLDISKNLSSDNLSADITARIKEIGNKRAEDLQIADWVFLTQNL